MDIYLNASMRNEDNSFIYCYDLDPLQIVLLKACIESLFATVTNIIN